MPQLFFRQVHRDSPHLKMAEVGPRLGSGVSRLVPFRKGQTFSVCSQASPGSLQLAVSDWLCEEKSAGGQCEVHSVGQSKATRRKLCRANNSKFEFEAVNGNTFLEMSRSLENASLHGFAAAWCLQSALQEKLPWRMTPWTRGAVSSTYPDTFTCPHQLRTFCTVVFTLPELKAKRLYRDTEQQSRIRNYNWRGNNKRMDALPLFRSRTAYYDILKVSSSATQSQIKTAYYKQSFIYHPDRNPSNKEATQVFSEISEAYTVLGNIALRRKYDRGILSEADVQGAGKPSSKESTSKPMASTQQQQRVRQFSHRGGKPIFDFDAFYQAHYGEQLQKERQLRARKQRMQEMQEQNQKRLQYGRILEMTVLALLASTGLILYNITSS